MHRERAQLHGRPTINVNAEESELLAEISARFPKLTAKFWEWWTRDKVYSEVREILRVTLLPLGFKEEEIKGLGMINFKREPLLVKFVLDYYVPDYTLYGSSVERERKYPAAILMYFLSNEYNEEMKSAVGATLQQWLAITEQHNIDR